MNVSLPYLWSSSRWKLINYKIISFGVMWGNCSVQCPCHHCLLLWIPACWGYKNVYQNTYTRMFKQMTNLFFRFLLQTQIVEQSSHMSCRPIFPVDMFASRWCHGITTSPCELRCMAVLINQKCCWRFQKIRRKLLDRGKDNNYYSIECEKCPHRRLQLKQSLSLPIIVFFISGFKQS